MGNSGGFVGELWCGQMSDMASSYAAFVPHLRC